MACIYNFFRRTFGFDEKHLPLFIFTAGSPFFLKNFMHTLGHFDIYGCALAIVLLLIPARSIAYVLLAALFSALLILVHHIHLLMYVPTIATIVLLRLLSCPALTRSNLVIGIAAALTVGLLFPRRAILSDGGSAAGSTRYPSAESRCRSFARGSAAQCPCLCLYLVSTAFQ